jgi:hypothetical protein
MRAVSFGAGGLPRPGSSKPRTKFKETPYATSRFEGPAAWRESSRLSPTRISRFVCFRELESGISRLIDWQGESTRNEANRTRQCGADQRRTRDTFRIPRHRVLDRSQNGLLRRSRIRHRASSEAWGDSRHFGSEPNPHMGHITPRLRRENGGERDGCPWNRFPTPDVPTPSALYLHTRDMIPRRSGLWNFCCDVMPRDGPG